MTDVGDRYVLERMIETGATLGGEQSGHVVDLVHHTTGDGLATALMLLAALERLGMTTARRRRAGRAVPAAAGCGAGRPRGLCRHADAVWQEVERREPRSWATDGRVVLRASGTEPVVRVMVEAADRAECEAICDQLAGVVRREIGV